MQGPRRRIATRRRGGTIALIASTSMVALAALGPAAAGARTCHSGVFRYGNGHIRTFCGPASAVVHVGGRKLRYTGGQCMRTPGYFTINLGSTPLLVTNRPVPKYFGLTVGRVPGGSGPPAGHDGSYTPLAVAIDYGGKLHALAPGATMTLARGRTRGTVKGKLLGTGTAVTASFRCR